MQIASMANPIQEMQRISRKMEKREVGIRYTRTELSFINSQKSSQATSAVKISCKKTLKYIAAQNAGAIAVSA